MSDTRPRKPISYKGTKHHKEVVGLIEHLGGVAATAHTIGYSASAVSNWSSGANGPINRAYVMLNDAVAAKKKADAAAAKAERAAKAEEAADPPTPGQKVSAWVIASRLGRVEDTLDSIQKKLDTILEEWAG